ncbi:MAG: zinc-ribbon domain-containing protein [candidate division WOR-3 bacterium]
MDNEFETETGQKENKKCPNCNGELEFVSSCCKAFWYCKNCDEIIGDIEDNH